MDAKHILFLLELFEGKISMEEILNMELPLLLNLEKIKSEQIEKEAKRIAAMSKNNGGKKGTIVNRGKTR
jgi:hypothetical protein